jgi:hypothetical protein
MRSRIILIIVGGITLAGLFLNLSERTNLEVAISSLEEKNGVDIYVTQTQVYASGCDKWDCAFKCYCAQSWKD